MQISDPDRQGICPGRRENWLIADTQKLQLHLPGCRSRIEFQTQPARRTLPRQRAGQRMARNGLSLPMDQHQPSHRIMKQRKSARIRTCRLEIQQDSGFGDGQCQFNNENTCRDNPCRRILGRGAVRQHKPSIRHGATPPPHEEAKLKPPFLPFSSSCGQDRPDFVAWGKAYRLMWCLSSTSRIIHHLRPASVALRPQTDAPDCCAGPP